MPHKKKEEEDYFFKAAKATQPIRDFFSPKAAAAPKAPVAPKATPADSDKAMYELRAARANENYKRMSKSSYAKSVSKR